MHKYPKSWSPGGPSPVLTALINAQPLKARVCVRVVSYGRMGTGALFGGCTVTEPTGWPPSATGEQLGIILHVTGNLALFPFSPHSSCSRSLHTSRTMHTHTHKHTHAHTVRPTSWWWHSGNIPPKVSEFGNTPPTTTTTSDRIPGLMDARSYRCYIEG